MPLSVPASQGYRSISMWSAHVQLALHMLRPLTPVVAHMMYRGQAILHILLWHMVHPKARKCRSTYVTLNSIGVCQHELVISRKLERMAPFYLL